VGIAGPQPRLLLVEDDEELARDTAEELAAAGHAVTHAATGIDALARALASPFDLLLIDRLLPGLDGIALIERLRAAAIRTPVLVLSALSAIDDRVQGLKAGGDDYLTKPFAMPELLARVEALLRRPADTRETVLRAGPLTLDLIERTATRGARTLDLLPREFRLLHYMARRPDQVLTRAMLLEDVWHYRFVPQTNLVDVHMSKLRRKVDALGELPLIHNVRGVGFALRVPG
jgi:two-component system OmpR family response regulator